MRLRWILILFGAVLIALIVTAGASAGTWSVTPEVHDYIGSTSANCPNYMVANGTPTGCIFSSRLAVDDGNWTTEPVGVVPATSPWNTNRFVFIAPNLHQGADGYVTYAAPDGSSWNLTFEDDESSGGTDGNYVGCEESQPQNSAYACNVWWDLGGYSAARPSVTFTPSNSAPTLSTGQHCAASLSSGQVFNCTASGMFAGDDSAFNTTILYQNTGTNATTLNLVGTNAACEMPRNGDQCEYSGDSGGPIFQMSMQASGGSGSYSVEVVSLADGPYPWTTPPDQGAGGDVAGRAARAAAHGGVGRWIPIPRGHTRRLPPPSIRALRITPANGARQVVPGNAAGRGSTISFRAATSGTTVFRLARWVRSRWVGVGGRNARSWFREAGVVRGKRCVPLTSLLATGDKPCTYGITLTGQFLKRHGPGRQSVRFNGLLGGRSLRPGLYRITAVTRARRSTRVSSPSYATFRVGSAH
jgi:hypothetical protein